jgi:hypothetical protein
MFRFLFGLVTGIVIFIYLDSFLTLKGSQAYADGYKTGRAHVISPLELELRCLQLWGEDTQATQKKKGML